MPKFRDGLRLSVKASGGRAAEGCSNPGKPQITNPSLEIRVRNGAILTSKLFARGRVIITWALDEYNHGVDSQSLRGQH